MNVFLIEPQCEESEPNDFAIVKHEYDQWLMEVERKWEEKQRNDWEAKTPIVLDIPKGNYLPAL